MERNSQNVGDILNECKRAFNQLFKRKDPNYVFKGKGFTSPHLTACCTEIEKLFSLENLEWEKKYHDRTFIETFILGVFQLGIQQGLDIQLDDLDKETDRSLLRVVRQMSNKEFDELIKYRELSKKK